MNERLKLTQEQQQLLCELIDAWYCDWSNRIIDWEDGTHRLGFAKEELKAVICDDKEFFKRFE